MRGRNHIGSLAAECRRLIPDPTRHKKQVPTVQHMLLPVPRRLDSGQPAIPNESLRRAHVTHLDQPAAALLDKRDPLPERVSRPHLGQLT